MRIELLDEAEEDLFRGARFYERQAPGLGEYFLDSLFADIDSLQLYAGIHVLRFGYCRKLSTRFPHAIYYTFDGQTVVVYAIFGLSSIRIRYLASPCGRRSERVAPSAPNSNWGAISWCRDGLLGVFQQVFFRRECRQR